MALQSATDNVGVVPREIATAMTGIEFIEKLRDGTLYCAEIGNYSKPEQKGLAFLLPKIDELKMRTSEFTPLERTPFWKLLSIVSRSSMSAIGLLPAEELIPLLALAESVLSRTVITTRPFVCCPPSRHRNCR